jgi:hypothetical protein
MTAPINPERAAKRRAERALEDGLILAALEQGVPLRLAMGLGSVDDDLEFTLRQCKPVRRALAAREALLLTELRSETPAIAKAALLELEREFGFERPGDSALKRQFVKILQEFDRRHPQAYALLWPLLQNSALTAAERRVKRRVEGAD